MKEVVKKLMDFGKVEQILSEVLEYEIFDDISKHSPYWQSENSEFEEKLYEIRSQLVFLEEKLFDALTIAKHWENED